MQEQVNDGKNFLNYIIPATVSMLLAGVYTLIDGLFVGWGAGSDALAAINVAFPFLCLFMGLGDLLGNGSAITIGYCRGRGARRVAGLFFGNLLTILIPLGILLAASSPFMCRLVRFMGADPEIIEMAQDYAMIIGFGAAFPIATNALIAVMRHDKAQYKAMYIMLAGLGVNIVLDYLLVIVLPYGAVGSAWATVAAQFLTALLCVLHFMRGKTTFKFTRRYLRPYSDILLRMSWTGLPSFGLQLSAALLLILYNVQAQHYGGLAAVAAYAVIAYVTTPAILLNEGIAQGIQPLISYLLGREERGRMRRIFRYGNFTVLLTGIAAGLTAYFGRNLLPSLFNAEGEVARLCAAGLALTAPALLLQGFSLLFAAYFQARQRADYAAMLVYGDCFLVMPLSLFLLPLFFGVDGVWAALPAAKLVITLLAVALYWRECRAGRARI